MATRDLLRLILSRHILSVVISSKIHLLNKIPNIGEGVTIGACIRLGESLVDHSAVALQLFATMRQEIQGNLPDFT